jgi:hypothetical protein
MSDVQSMAAMVIDRANESAEGQPQQFTLRGNPEAEKVMATLESQGVNQFTIVLRFRYSDDADVFPTFPEFEKGGRYSAARIQAVQKAQRELGALVQDAVQASIVGTDAENQELLVEAVVFASRDGGGQSITAFTTVISTDPQGGFRDRPIELL